MFKTFPVVLDITNSQLNDMFQVNNNDLNTIKLVMTVKTGMNIFDLTGKIVRIAVKKPDGFVAFQTGGVTDPENGICEFILDRQAYLVEGKHEAEVMIYQDDSTVIVTERFYYKVNRAIANDKTLISTNHLPAINQAIIAGEQLKDIDIPEFVEAANSAYETIEEAETQGLYAKGQGDYAKQEAENAVVRLGELNGVDAVQFKDRQDGFDKKLSDIEIQPKTLISGGQIENTTSIQEAIDSASSINGTCFIPFKGDGVYLVGSLLARNNVKLKIEKGVQLKHKKPASGHAQILVLNGTKNFTLEGNGVLMTMPKVEYTSEYSHAIFISDYCENIAIDKVNIFGTGGDGICIGGVASILPSENIVITNCVVDSARRNGLSIVHAKKVKVKDSIFKNSSGTAPQYGIDVEPNIAVDNYSTIEDVTFENCQAFGNVKTGIGVLYQSKNVKLINCTSYSNGERGFTIGGSTTNKPSEVYLNKCVSSSNTTHGFEISVSSEISLERCDAKNNQSKGFYCFFVDDINFSKCTASGNNDVGFHIKGSGTTKALRNLIRSCFSKGNYAGYYLEYLDKGTISNSFADSNNFEGINFNNSVDCVASDCFVTDNLGRGFVDNINTNLSISRNKIIRNKAVGLISFVSSRTSLKNNDFQDNGLYSDSTYKTNLQIHTSTDVSAMNNTVRETTGNTTIATNGILISSTANNVFILGNDCYLGGYSKGISNLSTSTINGGNRNKDGTYSTTPN